MVELFRSRMESALGEVAGARPTSARGEQVLSAAVRVFESLLGEIQRDALDERSRLTQALARAGGRIDSLERQLQNAHEGLLDAHRNRRGGWMRAGLLALGGFLGSMSGSAAEGAMSAYVADSLGSDDRSLSDYAIRCFAMDEVFEAAGVYTLSPAAADAPDGEEDDYGHVDSWHGLEYRNGAYYIDGEPLADGQTWRDLGFSPELATDWTSVNFTPTEALRWIAYDFDPIEAVSWIEAWQASHAEIPGPHEAAEWRLVTSSPEEAAEWHHRGFSAEEAEPWMSWGFDPEDASEWSKAGFDFSDAEHYRNMGFTPRSARSQPRGVGSAF